MDRSTFDHRSPSHGGMADRKRVADHERDGEWPMCGYQAEHIAVDSKDERIIRAAHSCRILRDGVQYRLDVGRRAADDAQNLARGRLLLERLLRLVEQPDILDRDDGLGGKGLQERDVAVGERADRRAPDRDRPDRLALAYQRDGQDRSEAGRARPGLALRELAGYGQIVDVDGPTVEQRAPRNPVTVDWTPATDSAGWLDRTDVGCYAELVPLSQGDRRVVGFAQPGCAPGDRGEDGLDVGGRA